MWGVLGEGEMCTSCGSRSAAAHAGFLLQSRPSSPCRLSPGPAHAVFRSSRGLQGLTAGAHWNPYLHSAGDKQRGTSTEIQTHGSESPPRSRQRRKVHKGYQPTSSVHHRNRNPCKVYSEKRSFQESLARALRVPEVVLGSESGKGGRRRIGCRRTKSRMSPCAPNPTLPPPLRPRAASRLVFGGCVERVRDHLGEEL